MEQPASAAPQPAPQPAPQVTPSQPAPEKKTPVWVWLLGGCFGLILISMLAIGGFLWWGARKIKQEYNEAKPNFEDWQEKAEQFQKEADEWQKESDAWQAEMEKTRKQIPSAPIE